MNKALIALLLFISLSYNCSVEQKEPYTSKTAKLTVQNIHLKDELEDYKHRLRCMDSLYIELRLENNRLFRHEIITMNIIQSLKKENSQLNKIIRNGKTN